MLKLENVRIQYDTDIVLDNVSFALEKGEIGCVLGTSGCGKTSVLRAIAGFKDIAAGDITIAQNRVASADFSLDVHKRNVGVVFQDYALFPHMTVFDNIGYGLKQKDSATNNVVVERMIALVGLQGHERKLPHQLSGGQQQRVAIARALAPNPDLLLLDEPFSSLDPEMRCNIAQEVRNIIKQNGITALLITHDQQEAFTVADKIGVFHDGTCQQWSSAATLYHEPKTKFIARFIGEGGFIKARVIEKSERKHIKTALGEFALPDQDRFAVGQQVDMLVRPDDIVHVDASPVKALVKGKQFRGANILYRLEIAESKETAFCLAPSHHNHNVDEALGIALSFDHVICFER